VPPGGAGGVTAEDYNGTVGSVVYTGSIRGALGGREYFDGGYLLDSAPDKG
jgi:hypothetical protein